MLCYDNSNNARYLRFLFDQNEHEMNLIIFDIDGTLTQTNEVDSKCFARAIKDILQIKHINIQPMHAC